MIEHPRLGLWMLPGGHVEDDESPAEAALRETWEESGRRARLLGWPAPALPAGYPYPAVPAPWWITELTVGRDNHTDRPHVHIDHQFMAVAASVDADTEPAHPFRWVAAEQLGQLAVVEDTELLARHLFPVVAQLLTDADRGPAALLRTLTAAPTW
ncbi:NUDIX domain-containing protein [Nocardia sp. NPDC057227]|uniref:NUDIX domain-containing protein n=1 Tax=Nocardia sp. NPDC057227 TaxID=3346056 RepID=UPI003635B329